METRFLLIRFGELSLKGGNRSFFEKKLKENIKFKLKGFKHKNIERIRGRILIGPFDDIKAPLKVLKKVFGISSISPVDIADANMNSIKEIAEKHLLDLNYKGGKEITFKVETKRADKSFPINSQDVSRDVGGYLLHKFGFLKAKMNDPEIILEIDIRKEGVFISSERIPGPGGLPVGTQGKALLLLSGGIDSPVAGWLSMKRGLSIDALHFDSFPYTSKHSLEKVKKLISILSEWGNDIKLYVAQFARFQESVKAVCNERYHTVIFRRAMTRVGDKLARKINAKGLISGENLGQVASQTIENLWLTESVCSMPILKPLLTFDKQEIIKMAQDIGTFETSILPYPDCCTVFTPKRPIIKGKIEDVEREETKIPVDSLLEDVLKNIKVY